MPSNGIEYEKFVQMLMQAILNAENIDNHHNIIVEHNKKLIDRCGIERQFDVYWEYEHAGFTYKNIIECKDYNRLISIEKVDALKGKMDDFPGIKAIIATKKGYQSGAETKAAANNMDILIIREQNERDWIDSNGVPLIRILSLQIKIIPPAKIIEFVPYVDENWVKENTNLDTTKPIAIQGFNNEILIDDLEIGECYSLYDWEQKLSKPENIQYNEEVVITKKFEDGYIINNRTHQKLKIRGIRCKYIFTEPETINTDIDAAEMMLGVVEYLSKGCKKIVMKNGTVWNRTN